MVSEEDEIARQRARDGIRLINQIDELQFHERTNQIRSLSGSILVEVVKFRWVSLAATRLPTPAKTHLSTHPHFPHR